MTTLSKVPTAPDPAQSAQTAPAAMAVPGWARTLPWSPWNVPMAAMPWELMIQGLMLHSSLWLAGAALQAQWWTRGLGASAGGPGWPVWHEPTEQLG